jgi:hypothetical protein
MNSIEFKTRSELLAQARRIRREIKQIFSDAEYWNMNTRKPHEEVINPDPNGQLKRIANNLDAMLKNERVI